MNSEWGKRRGEIMAFLNGLSPREKLTVLSHLANDAGIGRRIPDLARAVLDLQRTHYKAELIRLVSESPNLDLEFLARRKGCRLEPVEGPGDRWRIVPAAGRNARLCAGTGGAQRAPLTRKQALDVLRSLPDQRLRG